MSPQPFVIPESSAQHFKSVVVVSLSGKELGEQSNTKDLRRAAVAYAQAHFVGKTFINIETGHAIAVFTSGVKHTIAGAAQDLVKTIPALASIIQYAMLYKTEPDKRSDRNVLAVEKYKTAVCVGEESYTVLMTVKCYADGRRYYDHGFIAKK